jgi:hypothetical protein
MRKVLLATPSYDGKVNVEFMFCLQETLKLAHENGVALHPVVISHDALVQRVRNDFVKMAIETECDDLIFMDSDQEWNPAWVFQLLAHDVDVVGCPVPKKSDTNIDFNIHKAAGDEAIRENGLLAVKSVGTGFLRISRKALLQVWDAATPYRDHSGEKRMVFDVQVIDGELYSEDSVFCKKYADLGGTIYVDTTMTCNHIGTKKYGGNFAAFYAAFLEAEAAMRTAAQPAETVEQ